MYLNPTVTLTPKPIAIINATDENVFKFVHFFKVILKGQLLYPYCVLFFFFCINLNCANMNSSKLVLVTGATGFVASHCIRQLLEEGKTGTDKNVSTICSIFCSQFLILKAQLFLLS